jgi:hypothetical protein
VVTWSRTSIGRSRNARVPVSSSGDSFPRRTGFPLHDRSVRHSPVVARSCNDVALDFTILSIGANGAIFLNPRLVTHWKEFTGVYGIVVVLVNLLLASFLVYRRRWRREPTTWAQAYVDLFFGILSLTVTTMVFYVGYNGSAASTI